MRARAAGVDGTLDILEAGCGKRWQLDLNGIDYRLTGIDSDAEALRIRQETSGDLHEVIEADLREVDLKPEAYDVVYCSFVLEHVAGAAGLLDKMISSLRPGGIVLLRIPDKDSVYGFVTKRTPHWFHILFKRVVKGQRNAGRPGFGPYPVVYDELISVHGLEEYCADRGLTIKSMTGSNYHLDIFPRPLQRPVDLALRAFGALSFGRLAATHNNICLVAAKPQ